MFLKNRLYQEDLEYIAKLPLPWEKLNGKTVLVSGATGLIGTMLVDAIMMKNEISNYNIGIIALGRSVQKAQKRFADYFKNENFLFVSADVNKPVYIEKNIDFLFHCASNTHPYAYSTDPIGTIMTSVLGTNNLLLMAQKKNVERIVFLSTVEIYGENTMNIERFSEKDLGYIDCNTMRAGYPEGKRTGEALCQSYICKYGMDIVIPRICRVFGPTMLESDTKALAQFINNAVEGKNITLKSEGTQYYSYCYVADVISALLYILFYGESGEAYNIADRNFDIRLKDLASMLADIAGTDVIFDLPDAIEVKGFSKATHALLDSERLCDLGWRTNGTMYEALKKTVEILKEKHSRNNTFSGCDEKKD